MPMSNERRALRNELIDLEDQLCKGVQLQHRRWSPWRLNQRVGLDFLPLRALIGQQLTTEVSKRC